MDSQIQKDVLDKISILKSNFSKEFLNELTFSLENVKLPPKERIFDVISLPNNLNSERRQELQIVFPRIRKSRAPALKRKETEARTYNSKEMFSKEIRL